jgi:hypothetical protein
VKPGSLTPLVSVVVGILIAIGITTVTFADTPGGCVPGQVVAYHNDSLTPLLLANSPYSGQGSGTLPVENGSKYITLGGMYTNGSTIGYFERVDWVVRVGQSDGAGSSSCDQKFYLTENDDWTATIFTLSNQSTIYFVNDSQEPAYAQVSWSGGPMYFYNQFYTTTGEVSTCGTNSSVQTVTSNHIRVGVEFQYAGNSHVINITLSESTSYKYVFPANTGTWKVDNLSAPGGPGGGWAFSYSPCP